MSYSFAPNVLYWNNTHQISMTSLIKKVIKSMGAQFPCDPSCTPVRDPTSLFPPPCHYKAEKTIGYYHLLK